MLIVSAFVLAVIARSFESQVNAEYPYCFRFTWIGPLQDKEHLPTLTCNDLRNDLNTVPCRHPLVATDNDTLPNTVDLWRENQNRPNQFGCPMTPGQACVKYTYIYNDGVQNITYMCAKVNATNGCYRQRYISGLEVEVCVCQSGVGQMPCNYAAATCQQQHSIGRVLVMMVLLLSTSCAAGWPHRKLL